MPDIRTQLTARLQAAFDQVEPGADPVLRPSDRADYQANGVLPLAKRIGGNPQELARRILDAAAVDDLCSMVEVSGPGFINLSFATDFLGEQVGEMAADVRLGVAVDPDPRRYVVDYSAPNVAKEMHVGNLRSTIIGDALCRILTHLGHEVHRENHIGDWGTPFGMLIEHLVDVGEETAAHELSVGDLGRFYQQARRSFDGDPTFADRSRERVTLLQSGDPETRRLWKVLVDESVRYFDEVYRGLGVLLTDRDLMGESAYNDMLADVVSDLTAKGLLVIDDGAGCVFPEGFTNRDGDPLPLIVQKRDGGFGYAATDLAAIRDRVGRIGADRILYVIGAPQAMHLQMCFAVARMAGWVSEQVTLEHVAFGSVLGVDGKMLKTRTGDSVKLVDLLDEAISRSSDAIDARDLDPDPTERAGVARMLGIGAIKYADLSVDRIRDYVFDWDRMITFEGDTGPYLQYAHARVQSLLRRAELTAPLPTTAPGLADDAERALAFKLLGFPEAVGLAAAEHAPARLCGYLFGLSVAFASFYERCPVLNAPDPQTRTDRLVLAELTGRVLAQGLSLLGIEAPTRM